jgi:hypothetical protein
VGDRRLSVYKTPICALVPRVLLRLNAEGERKARTQGRELSLSGASQLVVVPARYQRSTASATDARCQQGLAAAQRSLSLLRRARDLLFYLSVSCSRPRLRDSHEPIVRLATMIPVAD